MAQERGAGRAKPAAEVPEEYRAIFEAVTDGLLITDLATGRIVEVNPALCRMHGYQRDELVGSLTTTIIHPGDHPLFTDFADAIRHGHEFRARRRDVTKDGRVFEVEVRGIQLPLRGRPHMLEVVRDITEQAAYRLRSPSTPGRGGRSSITAPRFASCTGPDRRLRTLRASGVGVTIVVHEHKRLGRGIELAALAEQLRAGGIGLEFLTGELQGSHDPSGIVFTVLAALSGMEGEYIRDRTLEGHESARARGKAIGSASVTDDAMLAVALHLRSQELSLRDIAARLVIATGK